MFDYNRLPTENCKWLLEAKAYRYNGILANRVKPRNQLEVEVLLEQMNALKAVIFARENTIRMEGF